VGEPSTRRESVCGDGLVRCYEKFVAPSRVANYELKALGEKIALL
jgi:hypothetical protein